MEGRGPASVWPVPSPSGHPEASPPRVCPDWAALGLLLGLLLAVAVAVGILGFPRGAAQPALQSVRLKLPSGPGPRVNQSVAADEAQDTVTYVLTAPAPQSGNRTGGSVTTVLFDGKNGFVCYRLAGQPACFLRLLESGDRQAMQLVLQASQAQREEPWRHLDNETTYRREFLGVLGGHEVDPALAGDPVRSLCQQAPIHWVRRVDGPGKQRVIYLCIDICFPNNICVSVCFYYLPD